MPIVIAFVSQKGGVGKSTLARALGAVVAHGGLSVLIADLDTQQSTTLNWSKRRDVADESVRLDVRSFVNFTEAIAAATDHAVLIVDAPGRASRATLDIARASHLIVIPSGPSLDDVHPTVLLHHELMHHGIAADRIAVAICRTLTKSEEHDSHDYLSTGAIVVLPGSLPERAAYRVAQNRGRSVTETDSDELNAMADELMEALLTRIAQLIEARETPIQAKRKTKGGAA
jgi:chromosome partitioning protein